MADEDNPFNEADFSSPEEVAFEMLATTMAKFYKALKRQGLSSQEAAALAAALVAQNMPVDLQGPQDGS